MPATEPSNNSRPKVGNTLLGRDRVRTARTDLFARPEQIGCTSTPPNCSDGPNRYLFSRSEQIDSRIGGMVGPGAALDVLPLRVQIGREHVAEAGLRAGPVDLESGGFGPVDHERHRPHPCNRSAWRGTASRGEPI